MQNTISNPVDFSLFGHLVDLLRYRANKHPHKMAYTFLKGGETEERSYTFAELDEQARTVAAKLQSRLPSSARVLLLYPNGVDYVAAFFGCLYAGMIAVPAYPPRRNRSDQRLLTIADNAGAQAILTTTKVVEQVANQAQLQFVPKLEMLPWIATDNLPTTLATDWQMPQIESNTLAFLQYTSGSTGNPKGVMVSHANLLHNLRDLSLTFDHTEESVMVTWLPIFHDMGLIYGILCPCYGGFSCYLMMPMDFIQKPLRWLRAISRYAGTHTAAPNFAFDLCVQQSTPEQLDTLDLSRWRSALNGAEPVKKETLDNFVSTFAPCGFRGEFFCPGYGLAEATLFVSAVSTPQMPSFLELQAEALSRNTVQLMDEKASARGERALTLVGCGRGGVNTRICIVNPQTLWVCEPGNIGEIWVSSLSVTQGYWDNPQATQAVFQAFTQSDDGPFLRTGDMGFIHVGILYVTGRLKDMIVIRGVNYYPNDIEPTIERSHPALMPSGAAVFSVEVAGEERLVVMQEVKRVAEKPLETSAVMAAIQKSVLEQHELMLYAIVLISQATLPKTTSGKVQRSQCRQAFIEGTIDKEIARWQQAVVPVFPQQFKINDALRARIAQGDVAAVQEFICHVIAKMVSASDPNGLDPQASFSQLGMDSLLQMEFMRVLADNLDIALPATTVSNYSSVALLSAYVVQHLANTATASRIELQPVDRASDFPLSFVQRRYWFHQATDPQGCFHNVPWILQWQGTLVFDYLQQSLDALVRRHEILRTTFPLVDDQPVQRIHDPEKGLLKIALHDLRSLSVDEKQTAVNYLIQHEIESAPFDLLQGPLMRVNLIRREETQYVLVMCQHHIISDMQSLFILTRELCLLYQAFCIGQPVSLSALPVQYADYTVWQTRLLDDQALQRRYAYWQSWLAAGEPSLLALPTDRPRQHSAFRSVCLCYTLTPDLTARLKRFKQKQHTSELVMGLSGLAILLYQYTRCPDIVIGTTFSYREHRKLVELVGPLTSVLQVRLDLRDNPTVEQCVTQTHQRLQQAMANQDVPFQQVARHFSIPTAQNPSIPFFSVLMTFFPHDIRETWYATDLEITTMDMDKPLISRPDLVLWMSENRESAEPFLHGLWRYREDLFEKATVQRLAGAFQSVMTTLVDDPTRHVDERLFS